MQHYNNFRNHHESEVSHCCCCFSVKCGSYTLGVFLILQFIFYVLNAIFRGINGIVTGLLGMLYIGYPLIAFIKMIKQNNQDSRNHYAAAYGCFAKLNSFIFLLVAISGVITGLIFLIIGLKNGGFSGGPSGFGV